MEHSIPVDLIRDGIIIGILAGIGEGITIRFLMDIFGLYQRMPIFG